MSVFDENREICKKCGKRINHWDQSSNDLHASGQCITPKDDKQSPVPRAYLLDLDITLADI